MSSVSIRAAAASLFAIAIAGCTTTGMGTGQSTRGNLGATFVWRETGGTRGTMVASLTNGEVFQGPMFQVTQESRVTDYGALWNGWGSGYGWHRPWSRWGRGGGGGGTRGRGGTMGTRPGDNHPLHRSGARQSPGSVRVHALPLHADAAELGNGRRRR